MAIYPPVTPANYVSPLEVNTSFEFVSAYTIYPYSLPDEGTFARYTQIVNLNGSNVFSNTYLRSINGTTQGNNVGYNTTLKQGVYEVIYEFGTDLPNPTVTERVTYYFSVVENQLPLKRKTVTDVINRLFDVAEPIRKGERPRFILRGMNADGTYSAGSLAERLDKILSPEFSFTKQNLRECLQEIGKFIHGEPRVDAVKGADGQYYYEISYDMYASQEESGVASIPYISRGAQHNVENYATFIDSNAENLVNQLDKFSGVIVEPYWRGAKTVRTETQYTRIEDGNMIIATQYPIYTIDDVEYVYSNGSSIQSISIKKWIFESSIYNSQLSSYDGAYPYSKAYGLYYTQGQKHIRGLNFKEPSAALQPFNNYAIINILRQAMGNQGYTVSDYPSMAFRVTYTPFYSVRVAQSKPYIGSGLKPCALIYNQQANVIESRAYGENMKGVIARIGNVERTATFNAKWFSDIPKAGQIYKKDYYITTVAAAIYPNYIKCTLGLSKDFNRLSAYIGISSVKRYYEVTQKQAVERNVLYREFILISDKINYDTTSNIGRSLLEAVSYVFRDYQVNQRPVTAVMAWGTSYRGNDIPATYKVSLPVISSAFGNSISFSWRYEDNFSAGAQSVYRESEPVKGYFQQDVQYTDYYGSIYYYNFALNTSGEGLYPSDYTQTASALPEISYKNLPVSTDFFSTRRTTPYILRKDNREILQVNVQIDFVTDIKDLIIGSALASNSPIIRGMEANATAPKLYVFPTPLNKFTDHVEAYEDISLDSLPNNDLRVNGDFVSNYFSVGISGNKFPASGKAWAIVTPQTTTTEQVEDEQGNITTQTVVKGGDLLIGQNIDFNAGDTFPALYFNKKRNVFDMAVWKDKK